MSPNEIATYVIDYVHRKEKSVTPMKLQKLLFYIKAWGLVAGVDVIPSAFRKWAFGPVNPNVYKKYKKYGSGAIPTPDYVHPPYDDERAIIDFVLSSYAQFSAVELSNMTHSEDPWKKAEANGRPAAGDPDIREPFPGTFHAKWIRRAPACS